MADAPAQDAQAAAAALAAFPAPPPFYKHFTRANLDRLDELRGGQDSTQDTDGAPAPPSAASQTPADLPPELRYLVPPAPPESGSYRCFGDYYFVRAPVAAAPDALWSADADERVCARAQIEDKLPTLSESQITQLYPSSTPASPTPSAPGPGAAGTADAETATQQQQQRNADRAFYLTKIAQSLLLNFLELAGILSVDPSQVRHPFPPS